MKRFLVCILAGLGLGLLIAMIPACKPKPDLCAQVITGVSTSVATAFACENPAALESAITKTVGGLCPKTATVSGTGIGALCAPAITLVLEAGLPPEAKCSGGIGKAAAIAACQALFP